jgi:hypothetical protein
VHGDEESGLGWYAPTYGTLVPTWTARTSRRDAAPFSMIAWIGSGAAPRPLDRLASSCDPGGRAVAVRVVRGRRTSVFLVRPGEPPIRDTRGSEVLAYRTNARVLHYTEEDERLTSLDLVDATHALALREGWLGVAADAPITDLHVTIGHGVLDLQASAPPSSLRLEGAALHGVRALRLNRRERVPSPSARRDTMVIGAGDWASALSAQPHAVPLTCM